MKRDFSKLDKNIQEKVCTIPQIVFVTQNPDDETSAQSIERQDKFLKLPENIKDKLASHETANKIKAIGAHYNLELLQMAPIARVVRSYYFGEVKLTDFASVIEKESKILRTDAENVARYLVDRIINKDVTVSKTVIKTEKKKLNDVLEIYPSIKNQKITNYSIDIDGERFAPTIENWIKDYYNVVGAGNRDIVKRSSYLYHSKNVKALSSVERQKLSTVLKSLDEGILIDILPDKKEIYFNIISEQPKTQGMDFNKAQIIEATPIKSEPVKEVVNNKTSLIETPDKNQESEILLDDKKKSVSGVDLKHAHGNNGELGSINFKEDDKKKSIFNFFSRKKEDDSGVKFSFPQQFPVEKEKSNRNIAPSDKKDFFGKIEPLK